MNSSIVLLFLDVRYFHIICLIGLFSCTKEVKIDIPEQEPQMVVDGRIQTDGAPLVLLMQSQYLYQPTDLASYFSSNIIDADVKVITDQGTWELQPYSPSELPLQSQITLAEMLNLELNALSFFPIKVYSVLDPQKIGEVGRTYQLKITYQGKLYEASSTLLPPHPLNNLAWIPDAENPNFGVCRTTLMDPIQSKNAYRWESKIIHHNNGQAADSRFRHGDGSYFNDQFFNGLTINFETKYPEKDTTYPSGYKRHFHLGDSLVVRFSHIENSVFSYFDKMRSQIESNGSPFASPVLLPTNIINGALGIWGAYSTWYDTLYCLP